MGGGPGYFSFLSSFIMPCMQQKTNTDRGISFVPNVRRAQAWTGTQQHDLAHAFPSVTETELWSQFYFCLQGWNQRKQSCELNILIFYTRLQELNVYKSTKQPNLCSFQEVYLCRVEHRKPPAEQAGAASTLQTWQLDSWVKDASTTPLIIYSLPIRPRVDKM